MGVAQVTRRHPFHIDAFVVLPKNFHAIWTLSEGDADFATRWMLIKAGFSRRLETREHCNASRAAKGERGMWQRRYWEHLIRDDLNGERHVDYMHDNPVKHGYIARAADWPHSSRHQYVAAGMVGPDWGVGMIDEGGFGAG